ncbi:hypothetical protein B0H16DRAFT_1325839, partial [Mycena metata]
EQEHKEVKAFYQRTNKNDAVGQITQLERREAALQKITRDKNDAARIPPIATVEEPLAPVPDAPGGKRKRRAQASAKTVSPFLDFVESESLPYTPPEVHFHISMSRNFHCNLPTWLGEHAGDPAVAVSLIAYLEN